MQVTNGNMANVYMQQTTYPGLALHCGGYGLLFHEFDSKSPIVKLAYARRVLDQPSSTNLLTLPFGHLVVLFLAQLFWRLAYTGTHKASSTPHS